MNAVAEPYFAEETSFGRAYILPKAVSAIEILPLNQNGATNLGLMVQLPEGADIEIGGPGFNDDTLRVRCGTGSYYIFVDDLDAVRKAAQHAHA